MFKITLYNLLTLSFTFYIYILFIFSSSFFLIKGTTKCIKAVFQCGPVPKQDSESVPKPGKKSLSASSLDCLCKAGASSRSCLINPNRTGNLSLLMPCTVSARQASLPGWLVSPVPGTFCYSCFSVRSCSRVLLGPMYIP